MEILELTTAKPLRDLCSHPDVEPYVFEDGQGPDDMPDQLPPGLYFGLWRGSRLWACLAFMPRGLALWDVHSCAHPAVRGVIMYEFAREAHRELFRRTACAKVRTEIPVYLRHVRFFAAQLGYVCEGVNKASFYRDGELHDQWVMGRQRDRKCQ